MRAASCSVFIKPITRHIFREEISAHMDLVPMSFYQITVKMQDENYQKNTSKLLPFFFFEKVRYHSQAPLQSAQSFLEARTAGIS